jgi:SAM-dependent methyltransferase
MNLIDKELINFYDQSSEETRLQIGLGPLEFERNKILIARYLQNKKCVIADVGGGTGFYAEWLSRLGHDVILIDPVTKHIDRAKKRSARSRYFRCIAGDARNLPIEASSVDLVILHGPLYHLQDRSDRIKAIKEASRVLRIGGTVLGFAITYSASTLAALNTGMIHIPEIFDMCLGELNNGDHTPPFNFPGILPASYFHKPVDLIREFELSGLRSIDLVAVEGLAWLDRKYFESWASPLTRNRLLDLVNLTESHPELLCISPHIMIAAEADYS